MFVLPKELIEKIKLTLLNKTQKQPCLVSNTGNNIKSICVLCGGGCFSGCSSSCNNSCVGGCSSTCSDDCRCSCDDNCSQGCYSGCSGSCD